MSCLCYCIGHHPGLKIPGTLRGVGGRPVYQVAHRRLSAAVSQVEPADLTPDLPGIRAYERVVDSCHRQGTIIPMRYGCVAPQDSQVIKLLAQHDPQYEALLQELAGCVEMGLRVLLPEGALGGIIPGQGREMAGPSASAAAPDRLGRAYLTARKAHYARQDRWTGEYRQAAQRYLTFFEGLFSKSKTEGPTPRLPLLSIYFLVQRPAAETFRQAFRHLSATEPARFLLSGPWPPYNFCHQRDRLPLIPWSPGEGATAMDERVAAHHNGSEGPESQRYRTLYEMLLEAIPSSVLLIDRDLRIVEANRNFLEKNRRLLPFLQEDILEAVKA